MYNIRKYNKETDYEMICIWWGIHDEPIPPPDLMTEYTYILENKEGIPWVSLSLMTFNTKWIAWSYGLVSNPDITPEGRKEAVNQLWNYIADIAKSMGYKHLLCIAPRESLEKRYMELGFVPTTRNQTFMVKELNKE